ncbi:aminotransferase-like domain-containing protein [Zavarzinella formosa]|uniref:aminotransferase-like domain-containing protein n=1 Tax=Zavarzinella formosa TaxID=360055 RepID=UPI0002FB304D|nr:PLP-dependent aminotransferase family protein [Zavarzinella formosa]
MSVKPLEFSRKAKHTPESPISYFMEQALQNPHLVSLAAGLVDAPSLPAGPIAKAIADILADPTTAKAALQYGTTQGYLPLLQKIVNHVASLDGLTPGDLGVTPRDVLVTTGSQQLLYMLSELMIDAGDIVITESPSYFVYHSVLAGNGTRVMTVPMDEDGLIVTELETLLQRIERDGELHRVKLLYTVDYFQNPTGLTLSAKRREELMEVITRWASKQRILVLEDAAYRELRYEGDELPSLKSFDPHNRHVIYAGTFSKPCAPGLKTGYAVMPTELVEPMVRLKGNHDFGSNNLSQHVLNRLLETGAYAAHVLELRKVYREKRNTMLSALEEHFGDLPGVSWTHPRGGMFVWFTMPEEIATSPNSPFLKAAIKEGVLYIPGEFGYVSETGEKPRSEARLSYGDASLAMIREGVKRLRHAADAVMKASRQPVGV